MPHLPFKSFHQPKPPSCRPGGDAIVIEPVDAALATVRCFSASDVDELATAPAPALASPSRAISAISNASYLSYTSATAPIAIADDVDGAPGATAPGMSNKNLDFTSRLRSASSCLTRFSSFIVPTSSSRYTASSVGVLLSTVTGPATDSDPPRGRVVQHPIV